MHVSQAKTSSNFFFSLREAKGHEMGDAGATTKTVNCCEKQAHGDNILPEIKQISSTEECACATHLLQKQRFSNCLF